VLSGLYVHHKILCVTYKWNQKKWLIKELTKQFITNERKLLTCNIIIFKLLACISHTKCWMILFLLYNYN